MSKEFKVGLLAVISGVILYFGYNFLRGLDFFSPTKKYYAIFDNIDGLVVSNPVILSGYSVGRVSNIKILQSLDNKIMVELDVTQDLILGDSTTATLTNSDFLGSKAIILAINDITHPLEDGDTLIAEVDRGLSELLDRAQPITDNISITIRRVNEILLGLQGSGEKINNTIDELNGTLKGVNHMIAANDTTITATIAEMRVTFQKINEKLELIDPIMQKTGTTLDKVNALELEKTLTNINELMAQVNATLETINKGDGTIGKLMTSDSLYNNLNQTLFEMSDLINHINYYPKHFTAPFGKSNKKVEEDLKGN